MNIVSVFKTSENRLVWLISLNHSWKTFLLFSSCVHTTSFISIRINIQKAKYGDFYARNISLTCERSSGYLPFSCHKPLETIVLNSQFYGRLRSIALSLKSTKFLQRKLTLSIVFFLWTNLSGSTCQAFVTFDKLLVSP